MTTSDFSAKSLLCPSIGRRPQKRDIAMLWYWQWAIRNAAELFISHEEPDFSSHFMFNQSGSTSRQPWVKPVCRLTGSQKLGLANKTRNYVFYGLNILHQRRAFSLPRVEKRFVSLGGHTTRWAWAFVSFVIFFLFSDLCWQYWFTTRNTDVILHLLLPFRSLTVSMTTFHRKHTRISQCHRYESENPRAHTLCPA